ncbi:MAG: hypothetical protein ABWY06_00345 [Pseudomonas sp.]|uniref:hypothetical protein n=1 Tax=Pseudomonas sp. TaxID=306 RepID=UPI003395EEC5
MRLMRSRVFYFSIGVLITWCSGPASAVGDNRDIVEFYSDLRKDVIIAESRDIKGALSRARPEGFFQNAGSIGSVICNELIGSLNKAGSYIGNDISDWLSESDKKLRFHALPDSRSLPSLWGGRKEVEYLASDIDGDGSEDYIYRRTGIVGSQSYQKVMIVERPLHLDSGSLDLYIDACSKLKPLNKPCSGVSDVISFLIDTPKDKKSPDEWASTTQNPLSYFTGDKESAKLIFPGGDNIARRNLGTSASVHWELYKIDHGVLLVSVPMSSFAPPELLAFTPKKNSPGKLQCVIAPISW